MDSSIWEYYDYHDWYHQVVFQKKVQLMTHLLTPVMKKRSRTCDVHPIYQRRIEQGAYHNLIAEMRLTNESQYFNYLRMTPEMFDILLSYVGPVIKKNLNYRDDVISPGQRLALTLRYLASGDSMISLSYAFRISPSTVSVIIRETCLAVWDSLRRRYLAQPTVENFRSVAEGFRRIWNFFHCAGAMDGKHIAIQAFDNSGSENYNFKNFHSIVLLAVCDAACNFILVDVGAEGRNSDGGIFAYSEIANKMADGSIRFPEAEPLTEDLGVDIPYFFVGDEAFPLEKYLLRPYPGRTSGRLSLGKSIFNYRLSRARRCIENAFGIMASRFRIFRKPIIASEETVRAVALCSVVLHNFIKSFDETLPQTYERYAPPNLFDREGSNGAIVPGEWRNFPNCFRDVTEPQTSLGVSVLDSPLTGIQVREYMKDFYLDEGAVPWQRDSVFFGQH